jgi:prepilin-type N-terminal cleavage/methylation domain-containing protein
MHATRRYFRRPRSRIGFTLTELMVVMAIIGVMVAMSAPSFQRAIEQSRAEIAVANLRAIWSAERLYWLEYHTYTDNIATLQALGVLDNAIPTSESSTMGGYTYKITASSTAMTATTARTGGTGDFTINESGDCSGTVTVSGMNITPGFQ